MLKGHVVLIVIWICVSTSFVVGSTTIHLSLDLYIAADRDKDEQVLSVGQENTAKEVVINQIPVARWVPIKHQVSGPISFPSAITRNGEMLVLLSADDIHDGIKNWTRASDLHGNDVPQVSFNDESTRKLMSLTGNNVGRHLAIVIAGEVWDAPVVQAERYWYILLPKDVDDVLGGPDSRVYGEWTGVSFAGVAAIGLIIVFAIMVGFAMIPLRDNAGKIAKCPIWCRWAVCILCAVIGAYWTGIGRDVSAGGAGSGVLHMEARYSVGLVWAFLGLAAGAVVGWFGCPVVWFLTCRALRNARRVAKVCIPSKK